jgi:hypothetical protein
MYRFLPLLKQLYGRETSLRVVSELIVNRVVRLPTKKE